ncbi:hypothetical protein ACIQ6Y_33860 [Streptomyces sp. NPDC096205]|uniref:hypothetical protein n=1 Tax=Streptomyces sp. NPDC096205 TaxID=3366081 RepID=UPI0038120552
MEELIGRRQSCLPALATGWPPEPHCSDGVAFGDPNETAWFGAVGADGLELELFGLGGAALVEIGLVVVQDGGRFCRWPVKSSLGVAASVS